MQIKRMKEEHEAAVMCMIKRFYQSSAVSHPVAEDILKQTFKDAVKEDYDKLEGYIVEEEGGIVGFAYVTSYYACEVGGLCVMLEEIYFDAACRGKGYGTELIHYIFSRYPEARRFRLEVTQENEQAKKLYERLGFTPVAYGQMVRDILPS